MCRKTVAFSLIFLLLLSGFSSVSASPPAKIVSSIFSNVVAPLVKWLWSLKSNAKPSKAASSRSMMKFESGYAVETVFDGSKDGIEPYSIEVSPSGDLLVLDSENSNVYRISTPLSKYSRPKLIAGSPEGYSGHVDGMLREARMSHPKGFTVDDRGNIYIADTENMAIRKISDGGVTTIAGGKWSRGGGHVDGPSEDAKFSNDFDVVYVGSSCSLLVIDRGNQAVREIQLHDDDCSYQSDGNLPLGIAMLVAAGLFGYMLALLQRWVQMLFSSNDDSRPYIKKGQPVAPYQMPMPPKSVRPPLIPDEDEVDTPEDGIFGSFGRLVINTGSTVGYIFGGLFSGFRKKPRYQQYPQQYQQPLKPPSRWPVQESFEIPDDYEPQSVETRSPTPNKNYPVMTKEPVKKQHFKRNRGYDSGWEDGDYNQQQQQQMQMQMQMQHHKQMQMQRHHQQQQHHRQYSSDPKTYYEKSCETNEIVFGAVQEHDGRRDAMVIKAVDYSDPRYDHHNIRPRYNYVGYSHAYN